MANYASMSVEELEILRADLQAQIESATEKLVAAGIVLERKREADQIQAELSALEGRKNELKERLDKVDQVVGLKTLDLRATFNKIFGR